MPAEFGDIAHKFPEYKSFLEAPHALETMQMIDPSGESIIKLASQILNKKEWWKDNDLMPLANSAILIINKSKFKSPKGTNIGEICKNLQKGIEAAKQLESAKKRPTTEASDEARIKRPHVARPTPLTNFSNIAHKFPEYKSFLKAPLALETMQLMDEGGRRGHTIINFANEIIKNKDWWKDSDLIPLANSVLLILNENKSKFKPPKGIDIVKICDNLANGIKDAKALEFPKKSAPTQEPTKKRVTIEVDEETVKRHRVTTPSQLIDFSNIAHKFPNYVTFLKAPHALETMQLMDEGARTGHTIINFANEIIKNKDWWKDSDLIPLANSVLLILNENKSKFKPPKGIDIVKICDNLANGIKDAKALEFPKKSTPTQEPTKKRVTIEVDEETVKRHRVTTPSQLIDFSNIAHKFPNYESFLKAPLALETMQLMDEGARTGHTIINFANEIIKNKDWWKDSDLIPLANSVLLILTENKSKFKPPKGIDIDKIYDSLANGIKDAKALESTKKPIASEDIDASVTSTKKDVTQTKPPEVPRNESQVQTSTPPSTQKAAQKVDKAATETTRQPTPLELSVGGGVVNGSRNICYGISLIQALRQSPSFRATLNANRPPEPIVLPTKLIHHIIDLLPKELAPDLKSLQDKDGKSLISVADYTKLLFLVEKNVKDLKDDDKKLIRQNIHEIKRNALAQISELFSIIDSGKQVEDIEIDTFRSVLRKLGWHQDEHENAQQDSQEFLAFVFNDLLGTEPFQFKEIGSQDVSPDLAFDSQTYKLQFKPCAVPTAEAVEPVYLESLLNPTVIEQFEPIDQLYRRIIEPNKDKNSSKDLQKISNQLTNLFSLLPNLSRNDPNYTYQSDPVYTMLTNPKDLSNITSEEWNAIKEDAKLIYYEKSLINLLTRFSRDPANFKNTGIKDLGKLVNETCHELKDTNCYKLLDTLLDDLQNPDVASFFSVSTIDKFINELDRDIISDEGISHINETNDKAITDAYRSLKKNKNLTEDQKNLLTLLTNNISQKKPLKFNLNAIKSELAKTKLKTSEMEEINETINANDRILKSNQQKEISQFFLNVKKILSIPAPDDNAIDILKTICINVLKDHEDSLQPNHIEVIKNLINGANTGQLPTYKDTFNMLQNEFGILKERHKVPEIPVKQTFTLSDKNPPELLPVTLNRFLNDGIREQCIKTPVAPSHTIKVQLSSDPPRFLEYNLKAVVVRSGEHIAGAHFYTYVPQPNGKWVEFNDTKVREVDLNTNENDCLNTILTKGYIYLYELKK